MVKTLLNRKKLNPFKPIFTGSKYLDKTATQLFSYNNDEMVEVQDYQISDFNGFPDHEKNYWLNIHGIHDVDQVTAICEKSGIHNLVVQDILDVNQRPKFQEYDDYFFLTMKSVLPTIENRVTTEHLSFILGKNYIISFQEKKGDYFEHVRQRMRDKIGLVNQRGCDYLFYLLLESILDNYFKTIDNIENKVIAFEIIEIESDPSPAVLNSIEVYKREIQLIKKAINPIKEFTLKIEREKMPLINKKQIKYYMELKDLCLTLLDSCDHIVSRLDSSINLFFSIQGHRMNQVMKTLTVVSTIFIPLTFIAGVYGMNFINMPELNWKWGYFGILGIMLFVFLFMLNYFRKKKWF